MAIESPTNDFGKAAKGAKSAAGIAQKVRQFIQVAKVLVKGGTGPVGWLATAAQFLAPLIKKIRKAAAIVGGAIFLRLLMHIMQLVGLVTGLAFGAISGLPLLLIPGAGPFLYAGWVAYWGYRGFTNPFDTIQLATHPWEIITRPLNWLSQRFSDLGAYFKGGTQYVGSGVGNAASTVFYNAANFVTGLASSIWGWTTSLIGNTAGWLSGVASHALGLASTLTSSVSSIVSVGVGGTVAAVGVGTLLVATTNMVALTTTEGDLAEQIVRPGVNEFFTIEKTASPTTLASADNSDIIFTIKLTAKVKLTAISISDEMTVQSELSNSPITVDKSGNSISPPCASTIPAELAATANWTCQITIVAKGPPLATTYDNSTIINRVNITATPDGAASKVDSTSATVKIGNPPTSCPSGWPTQTGEITQGPMGHTSHGDPPVDIGTGGLEAIDIGVFHENVYSTVDGTVTAIYQGLGTEDNRVDVAPIGCPNLDVVSYWHLLSVSVVEGQRINATNQVGVSGLMGTGYHTHYQFGRAFDRNPQITDYVPKPIRRDCNGDCSVSIP